MPPVVSSITLVSATVTPPTWSFALLGSGFVQGVGAQVVWTPPGQSAVTLHDADILSVTDSVVKVVTTYPLVAMAGTYNVAVRNPSGETSVALVFQMGPPGIIVRSVAGYLHYYGYAFVRPPTPNTTNAPLGLAPGATVTIYESGTTNLVPLFADQMGNAQSNPVVADENAFFSVYLVPIPVDVQYAGGGILTRYTIGDAIPLDPRIPALETAVAALEGTATGATAGTPGTWTPAGSVPRAKLSAMPGCTATPGTAWTTGQHMVMGDANHCYWNGTAWTAGNAP